MAEADLDLLAVPPRMRSDLRIHKHAASGGQPVFELEEALTGKRHRLFDFELSITRMLNGRRTVSEVIAAAGEIGIPVSLPSFNAFVRKLRREGLLEVGPGAAGSPAPPVLSQSPKPAGAPQAAPAAVPEVAAASATAAAPEAAAAAATAPEAATATAPEAAAAAATATESAAAAATATAPEAAAAAATAPEAAAATALPAATAPELAATAAAARESAAATEPEASPGAAQAPAAPGPAMSAGTWEPRQPWTQDVRGLFQQALKAFRSDRLLDAQQRLQLLLSVDQSITEASDLLRYIERQLAADPTSGKSPSFVETFRSVEHGWTAGDAAPAPASASASGPAPAARPAPKRRWALGVVFALVILAAAVSVPLPYAVQSPCRLEARGQVEVKMHRAGVIGALLVSEGQWVEKGAVLARLEDGPAKARLDAIATRTAELHLKAKRLAGNKKQLAARTKLLKAELLVKKSQAALDGLLARSKQKRTAPVVKAEKKLAAAKALAERAAKAAGSPEAGALEAELAKLTEEKAALQAQLERLEVVAPAAGFLVGAAQPHTELAEGAVVGRLEDSKILRAIAYFSERDRSFIRVDQPLRLTVPAGNGKVVSARVLSAGPSPNAQEARSLEVAAELDNADGALKPGSTGSAELEGATRSLLNRVL